MSDDLAMMAATEMVAKFRARTLSPVEATRAALDRIDKYDSVLNAFVLVCPEEALATARESEARWLRGEPKGLVDGVPTSIKDLLLMKGYPTRRGSLSTPEQAEAEDAPATARLREHGAVLIGKTTAPEFGWKGVTDSPLTGITRNPWDPSRTSGGSSGGSASSVAAGMGTLALGSDGGGSIRIPASLTGIFGHKATVGRVPYYPPTAVGTCAMAGPMTRTVGDAALMMNVVAQYDPRDWMAIRAPGGDYLAGLEDGVRGLRIALCPSLGYAAIDADVDRAVRKAGSVLAELGAAVEEIDKVIDSPRESYETFYRVAMASIYRTLTREQRQRVDPGFAEMSEQGLAVDLFAYKAAERERALLGLAVNAFLERYDLILSAQLGVTAFAVGHEYPPGRGMRRWMDWASTAYPFNFTGHPAASVPCGFGDNGMPVGLQIVGRRMDDALVLRVSRAYERVEPFPMPDLGRIAAAASAAGKHSATVTR
jgi:aspartyl-tRNA(Asn)/glutamyl-tRNA(Gln) amidotransferase subunit A